MDVKLVLRPVYHFSNIFTLVTFDLNGEKQFCRKKKNVFYYLRIVLMLIFVSYCVIASQFKGSFYNSGGVITSAVQFANYNCRLPVTLICLVMTNLYSDKNVVQFLNAIEDIDKLLKKLGQVVEYKRTKKIVLIAVGFTFFKLLLQHIPFFLLGSDWNFSTVLDYVTFNIPLAIMYIITLQWMSFLHILKIYFIGLNKLLKTLKYRQCWVIQDLKTFKNRRYSTAISNLELIRNAGLVYDNLCLQGYKINNAFAWQILVMVPSLFILIIFSSFNVCQMIKDKVQFDSKIVIFDILYFIVFLELIFPCVAVKEESDKFVDILHRIDMNFEGSSEIDDLMNTITLQTYHQKIEFSAYGVFPLDGTLIYSIFGALTTYLVILLQFDV